MSDTRGLRVISGGLAGIQEDMGEPRPARICDRCGRSFTWRRKWERSWDDVRHCSERCRRRGVRANDVLLEQTIARLLTERAAGSTICPSEAARAVSPDDWRALMEPTREAARRMAARGELVITQAGRVVDPSTARGPIRLRRLR